MFHKYIILISIASAFLIVGGLFIWQSKGSDLEVVSINGIRIEIGRAVTTEEKIQGLSGRDTLGEYKGMLFVYDEPDTYSFWMKSMQFPIDIIWIDGGHKVIDITKNIQPDSFPRSFKPKYPARYVLEVNAGFSDKNNVAIGDKVAGLELK